MQLRPFRFSVQMTELCDRRAWRDRIRRAEAAGYDMVVTADHVTDCAPPLVSLAATAQMTDVLRLGLLVANNDLRLPSVLARETAAVDILSDGRVELGLGAGYAREEYERIGLTFEPARRRLAKLEESVSIVRRLLDGEWVDHHGEFYEVAGEACSLRPRQEHVPIIIGGGRKGILELAARHTDTVAIASGGRPRTAESLDRQIAWVRAACDVAGRQPELQSFVPVVRLVHRSVEEVRSDLAVAFPELSEDQAARSPYTLVGSAASLADDVLSRRERWGITHYTVRAADLDAFAAVIAILK